MTNERTGAQALLEQMGGVKGLIYSSLPILVFVPVNTAFGLMPAIVSAVTIAVLVLIWRLLRKESLQPAVSGFIGVGVSALIAWYLGAAKGFFLLGIWVSLFWASVFTLSVLFRRPVVGLVWSWANGHGQQWRRVRGALVAFDVATLTWVLVFGARFLVQQQLYDADQTGLLGIARIAMGWPLTALAALATYVAIKKAQRHLHAAEGHPVVAEPDEETAQTPEAARPE